MRPIVRELIAGTAASAFFLALLPQGFFGFLPLLGLAGVVYLGARLMLPAGSVQVEPSSGEPPSQVEEVAAAARRFTDLSTVVSSKEAAANLRRVARAVQNLANQFEREPEALPIAAELLGLHIPSALSLAERHVSLAGQPHLDASARQELEESERTIGLVAEAFEAQYARLLEQDVRELRVDRLVFEELLRLDDRPGLQGSTVVDEKERS